MNLKIKACPLKWFLKNQQRLIDQLKEPKFTKRAREIIEKFKKREATRVDKPIVCDFDLLVHNVHLFFKFSTYVGTTKAFT